MKGASFLVDDMSTQKRIDHCLRTALGYLDGIDDLNKTDSANSVDVFMEIIGKLCLENDPVYIHRNYESIKSNKNFTPRTICFIRKYVADLEEYLFGIFEGYHEWENVCYQRTNIEAFNAFFGQDYHLDVSEFVIDELMRERCKTESVKEENLPEKIPKRHWWWGHQESK